MIVDLDTVAVMIKPDDGWGAAFDRLVDHLGASGFGAHDDPPRRSKRLRRTICGIVAAASVIAMLALPPGPLMIGLMAAAMLAVLAAVQ